MKDILKQWLPAAFVITAMCVFVYIAVRQVFRISANDPQIQMAEDAAEALARGQGMMTLLPSVSVDVAHSLAPFLIVYDEAEHPLASSALLHGNTPIPPDGVFNYVREHGENRLTWQPEHGVRIAAIMVRYQGAKPGFVLAGRSLREVQKRIDQLALGTEIAWVIMLVGSFIVLAFIRLTFPKKSGQP